MTGLSGWVDNSKKGIFSMVGGSYTCLFTLIYGTHKFSTWELEVFTGFTMLRSHLDESNVGWLGEALRKLPHGSKLTLGNCRELELSFLWAPSQCACKHSLTCQVCYHSLLAQLSCWACAVYTSLERFKPLKIGRALNSLSFEWRLVNTDSWGLQLEPYY
jgi:hypothetical protein